MQTTITALNSVEFELTLSAPAEVMRPRFEALLKKQRKSIALKGFRPGKTPLQVIEKMYGPAFAQEFALEEVQQAFNTEVLDNPAYRVIGRPALYTLEYDGTAGLSATLRFGVQPSFDFSTLSEVQIDRLIIPDQTEELERVLTSLQDAQADLTPAPEGTELSEEWSAVLDLYIVNEETDTLPEKPNEAGTRVRLSNPEVQPELKEALMGKKVGDTFRVTLTHDVPHGDHSHTHTHLYHIEVKDVVSETPAPLDDALAAKVSDGRLETLEDLRADILKDLNGQWEKRQRDHLETEFVQKLPAAYPVEVPFSATELFLDAFVKDVKAKLKEGEPFDEESYRRSMVRQAITQARWMLIRNALMDLEQVEVTEEDINEFFTEQAGGQLDPALFRRFYEQAKMMDQVESQIQSRKLFAALVERVKINDITLDELRAAMDARADVADAEDFTVVDEEEADFTVVEGESAPDATGEEAPAEDAPRA